MKIGILKENKAGEKRVAIIPSTVSALTKKGYSFFVQQGAGNASHHSDNLYTEAGATIVEKNEVFQCDIITKVNPPIKEEIELLNKNCLLISLFQTIKDIELVKDLQNVKCSAFSLNLLPRITLAQKMDILSSQANIAGYKSVLIGANHIGKYMPLLMTAAGTISPSRILVIGAGVAGLQAIATAKRLGAQVQAFDVRPEVKEQVESLGAKFVEVENDSDDGVGSGGYAKETSDAYKLRQQEAMRERISKSDLVITTALIPNRPAPILIPKEMVEAMKPGSVIVDMAVASGGNVEGSVADEYVVHEGVTIIGMSNLPGEVAMDASQVYGSNLFNMIEEYWDAEHKKLNFDLSDEVLRGCVITHDGEVVNSMVKERM